MSEINKKCKLCCALPHLNDTGYDWENESYSVGDMRKMIESSTLNCNSTDFENIMKCDDCKFGKLKKKFMKILIKINNIDINNCHVGDCFLKHLKCLIELGVDVNKKINNGNPYLILLMKESIHIENFDEFVEKVNILIDAGIDVNAQNNDGETALLELVYFCKNDEHLYDLSKLLLEKGADKTINNKLNGYVNGGQNWVLKRVLRGNYHKNIVEIIKLFVDYGLKPMENKENINYGSNKKDEKVRKEIEDLLFPPENTKKQNYAELKLVVQNALDEIEKLKLIVENAMNKIAGLEN